MRCNALSAATADFGVRRSPEPLRRIFRVSLAANVTSEQKVGACWETSRVTRTAVMSILLLAHTGPIYPDSYLFAIFRTAHPAYRALHFASDPAIMCPSADASTNGVNGHANSTSGTANGANGSKQTRNNVPKPADVLTQTTPASQRSNLSKIRTL